MFNLLLRFLKDLQSSPSAFPARDERKSLTRVTRLEQADRNLEGVLESGDYGYETELIDVAAKKKPYRRGLLQAELFPFSFLFHVPKAPFQGILILQRFENLGVRSVLGTHLEHYIKDHWSPPVKIEINPLVPEQVIEKWTAAKRAKRVRLVSFEIPKHIETAFKLKGRQEVYTELVISAKRRGKKGGSFPLAAPILELLRGEGRDVGIAELQDQHPHDVVKIEVDVGGKTRTVDVSNPGKMAAYFDITSAVAMDTKTGHPTWASLQKESRKLLRLVKEHVHSFQPASVAEPSDGQRDPETTPRRENAEDSQRRVS